MDDSKKCWKRKTKMTREEYNEYQRNYRRANKDRINARNRERYHRDPELRLKYLEQHRRWYDNNREYWNDYQRDWHRRHPKNRASNAHV